MSIQQKDLEKIAREWDIPEDTLRQLKKTPAGQQGLLLKEIKRRISLRLIGL